MVAWILGKLKWLGLILALGPMAFAYFEYESAARDTLFAREGKEAVATIEGATKSTGRRRGTSYSANLSWRDDAGQTRRADKVSISSSLADKLFADNKIVRDSVKIRYIPNDPSASPMVTEERTPTVREPVRAVVNMLPLLVPISLIGAALFFVLWRAGRRTA
jgi:hypothetical protein